MQFYQNCRKSKGAYKRYNSNPKSKMKLRRQERGDAGVLPARRGTDDEANEDSALI